MKMTTLKKLVRTTIVLATMLLFAAPAQSQFLKKLGKAAERAAARTVENRVERETQEKTDAALDSILEPGDNKGNKKKSPLPNKESGNENGESSGNYPEEGNDTNETNSSEPKSIAKYSKFDFVAGDKLLFFDDFSNDFMGDFPAKWNTNAGGDLVTIDGYENKWLNLLPGYNTVYIPDLTNLPAEFTLEFDVLALGINKKTSSQANLGIIVGDNNTFDKAKNWAMIEYPFCQFIDPGLTIENNINGKRVIRSVVKADIKSKIREKHHISIAVNEQRFRFWINEEKYFDVPRLLPKDVQMQSIKFYIRNINTETESIHIANIKIAEGGLDLRKKLLAEGKISTNGILFDSGSANIQPQSMGIIRQISQVLMQERTMNLKIVGHTDADGGNDTNLNLSKSRAQAVKKALVDVYTISEDRLSADGKGESEPIGDNATADGKAQNRRVEFIKQ
jgi:outer membrane protein OmpA-like peptidoglycan-associated protein